VKNEWGTPKGPGLAVAVDASYPQPLRQARKAPLLPPALQPSFDVNEPISRYPSEQLVGLDRASHQDLLGCSRDDLRREAGENPRDTLRVVAELDRVDEIALQGLADLVRVSF
jgi:hypothetical protein